MIATSPRILLTLSAAAFLASIAACSGPMPAMEGTILGGLNVAACTAATAASISIPIPGAASLVGFACAEEEAAVSAAIAHAEQQAPAATIPAATSTADAGSGAMYPGVPTAISSPGTETAARGAPLYRGTGSARHVVGACPCGWPAAKVALAQARLDALDADGGAAKDGGS